MVSVRQVPNRRVGFISIFAASIVLIGGLLALTPVRPASAAGTVGTGTAASCDEAALDTALSGGGTVTFDCGTSAHTITVTSTKVIASDTTIDGGGLITLSGGDSVGVLSVNEDASLTLQNLTISSGSADYGGGISNLGTLTITDSTLTGNNGTWGGSIRNNGGTLTITNSTLSANSAMWGGVILNDSDGTLTITGSTLSGNSATWGGGVDNTGYSTATITSSTLSGNSADYGGGIINSGMLTVTSSTLTGNSADYGGGINNTGTLTAEASIIANNSDANCSFLPGSGMSSNGYNLSDDTSCDLTGTGDQQGSGVTVNLGPLADNGGPTQTHLPQSDSAAIDAIPAADCPITTGQRGTWRPQDANCEIGSVELEAANAETPTASAVDPVTTDEDTAAAITLSASDPDSGALAFTIGTPPAHGSLSGPLDQVIICDSGTCTAEVTYEPDEDYSGPDSFSFTATDDEFSSNEVTVSITVNAVNDPPSFTAGGNQTVDEDAGAQSAADWATDISPGPSNESGQTVTFQVSNDNNGLFSAQPAIASDGTLTYTPVPDANGQATVTVSLQDDGGTANGGDDTSAEQQFTITVSAVNDAPGVTSVTNDGPVAEGSPVTITMNATDIESSTLSYSFDCDNDGSYEIGPQQETSATCTFPDEGEYQVTVQASDGQTNATGSTTVTVTNAPPVIEEIISEVDGSLVTLTVDTTDVDSDVLSYAFDCNGGASRMRRDDGYEVGPQAEHTVTCDVGDNSGDYRFAVRVTDGDGGEATEAHWVDLDAEEPTPCPDDGGRTRRRGGCDSATIVIFDAGHQMAAVRRM